MPTPRRDVHKRTRRSMSGSRDEGVGGLHLTHTYDTRLTNFRDREPAVQIQGRGCTPPPPAWALLGTPTGGYYPDPGYQHEEHHRLSPHTKSSVRIDPRTEIQNEEQPEERPASRALIPQVRQSRRPGARRRVHATETIETQENRSEQMYRPLGDRLGPEEPAQVAYKR